MTSEDKPLSTKADGARMAMAPQSSDYGALAPVYRMPYIPDGCDQQGRMRAGRRLTEADLDRHNAERLESRTLPELLLEKGSMTGPFRKVDHLRNCPHRRVEWPSRIAAAAVLAFLGWLAWRALA